MELIQYWRVIRQHLWLIVLCPLIAATAAGIISLQLPKMYQATVLLYVRTAQLLPADPGSGVAPVTADQVLHTYAELMVAPPQLQKVISDQNLPTDPVSLSKQITVTPHTNTLILEVSVRDTDPGRSERTANTLVDDFISYVKQIQSQDGGSSTTSAGENLVVASPATLPTDPVSPKPLLNVALALVLGLMAGAGLAFLLDYLDQTVRDDETLRQRTGLTPLGHVAYVPAASSRRGELVVLGKESPAVEAYKAIRTNLLFSGVDHPMKTIVITSAAPNEGKSRTAANLAIVLAQAGHRTLLVDADFRRPSQHRIFGRVRNIGLSNLFVEDLPEATLFNPDEEVRDLVVLCSGPTPPNPSELLGSTPMKALLAKFNKTFDFCILDTPPVNAVTDASVMAANADGVIVVVEANKATYAAVLHARQALQRVGANVIGSVMNKMKATGAGYYYYRYGYTQPAANGKPDEVKQPVGAASKPGG